MQVQKKVDRQIPISVLRSNDVQEQIVLNEVELILNQDPMADLDFTPITSLTLASKAWVLRARVGTKIKLKTYRTGCLFKCLLFDTSGEVELIFYNDLCNKFFELVQEGHIFIVTNADVQQASKYNNSGNSIELKVSHKTKLNQETKQIIGFPSYIKPQSRLKIALNQQESDKKPQIVHGIVLHIGETEFIVKKDGTKEKIRTILIGDEFLDSVEVKLWGDVAGADLIDLHEAIVLTNVKKCEYLGVTRLQNSGMTKILQCCAASSQSIIDLSSQDGIDLTDYNNLSQNTQKPQYKHQTIHEILQQSAELIEQPNKKLYIETKGIIAGFSDNVVREACPTSGCYQTVKMGLFEQKECSIHGELSAHASSILKYSATVKMQEGDESIWVSLYSDDIGQAIFKRSAQQLFDLQNIVDRHAPLKSYLSTRNGSSYIFRVCAQTSTYNGIEKVSYKMTSVEERPEDQPALQKRQEQQEFDDTVTDLESHYWRPSRQIIDQATISSSSN